MAAELTDNLVATLEKIKNKRYELTKKMEEDQELLAGVTAKIEMRSDRLSKVIDRKNKRMAAKKEYEKTIMETEAAYKKILESSALLLKSLQDQAGEEAVAGVDLVNEAAAAATGKEIEKPAEDGTPPAEEE